MKGARQAYALALLVVLGVLASVSVKEIRDGARAIDDADAALAQPNVPRAIVRSRDAAEAVVPGSPYPTRGYERLEAIARDAESRGDDATASSAWEAMRAAGLATRGLFVKTEARIALATESLVRLNGAPQSADGEPKAGNGRVSSDALLDSLHRTETPPTLSFILLALGASAFFGGVARLAWGSSGTSFVKWPLAVAVAGGLLYLAVCLRA